MSMIFKTASALSAWTLLAASAQAAAPAPAAPAASFGGPSIPGVCLFAQEAVLANALVGKAATARLQQLAQGMQTELAPEQKAVQDEAKALETQKATLPAAQLQQRQQALVQRAQALQTKTAQREQQLEATRAKALQRISQDEQPTIADVYKARNCGVLFNRSAVMAGGQGMDLTPAVVQALDAKIKTISFDLEPPAPAAPAAAR